MNHPSFPLAALLALAALSPASAQDAIDAATLEKREAEVLTEAASKHVAFAAKIEKTWKREAYFELVLALELDRENAQAREKLGYKKEGSEWKGTPDFPALSARALDQALVKERDRVHEEAARKLAALAAQAKKGGLEPAARRLAGIALDEKDDEATAREVLGHERKGAVWLSPREARVQAAFTKAIEKADGGKEVAGDVDLTKLLDLGVLARRESDHLILLATKGAACDLAQQGKLAEVTWVAMDYFLQDDATSFSVEGEETRTGDAAQAPALRLVFVAPREHGTFIEHTMPDERKQKLYKKLSGAGLSVGLPTGSVPVFETCLEKDTQSEWTATTVASYLVQACVKKGSRLPDFVFEGIRRFMSGHVSGRAGRSFYGEGSGTLKDRFQGATFVELRSHVRESVATSLEGDLKLLIEKKANDLEREDAAKALAFLDYAFAKERKKLLRFLAQLAPDELPLVTFEKTFQRTVDEVERDFREFVREQY